MSTPGPLRIGDVERDAAAAELSEHYAAGRLTKPEYDERLEAVWSATFDVDLKPVFADLPGPHGVLEQRPAAAPPPNRMPPAAGSRFPWGFHPLWLAPLVVLGFGALLFAAVRGAPWLLFIAFWFFMAGGFGRARGFGHRHGRHHHHA